jgi:hypothetical protein
MGGIAIHHTPPRDLAVIKRNDWSSRFALSVEEGEGNSNSLSLPRSESPSGGQSLAGLRLAEQKR